MALAPEALLVDLHALEVDDASRLLLTRRQHAAARQRRGRRFARAGQLLVLHAPHLDVDVNALHEGLK